MVSPDKYIEFAIEHQLTRQLEGMLEVYEYSIAMDGEPDYRALQGIGADPVKLTSEQVKRIREALEA